MYFKRKNPLSEELGMMYFRSMSEAVSGWLNDVGEEFDSSVNIITEKAIRNKCKIELTCGNNIEYFSHSITPELIILFKEYCDLNNIDPEELLSEVF
jgi:hypothetical protein